MGATTDSKGIVTLAMVFWLPASIPQDAKVPSGRRSVVAICPLISELREVNERLWELEDQLSIREANQDFGPAFVELSRAVYKNNDQRATVKRRIDELVSPTFLQDNTERSPAGIATTSPTTCRVPFRTAGRIAGRGRGAGARYLSRRYKNRVRHSRFAE